MNSSSKAEMMKVTEDVEDPNQFILDVVQERIAALDHEDAKKKKKPPKTDTSIQQEYNMAKKVASGCAQQQHDEDDDTENSSQFILGVVEERLSYQVGAAVAVGEEQEQHAKKADKDGGKAKEVHAVVPVGVPVESNTATTAPCSFTKVSTDAAPTRLSRQRNVSRVSRPGAFSIAPRGAGRGGATAATTTSTLDDANGSAISSSVVHNNDQHNNDVEDGLAVARMVSALPEAELQQYVEEETTPATSQEDKRKRMALWLWPGLVLILFLGVILLLVMLLVVQAKEGDPTNGALIPQAQPNRPTQSLNDHILSLLPDETVRAIQAELWSSPQKKAYQWLVQDPYLNSVTYPDWRLVQRFALATFFYATDGENWKQNTDWLSYEIPECEWYKSDALSALVLKPPMDPVYYMNPEHVCDGPGFYRHLWLGYSGLQHSLPDELFLLTHLRSIALGRNELTGTLSSRMGLFQDLEGFAIAHTNIEGSIPTELGLLSNLTALVLVDQPLRSTIPSELGLLSDILYIQIDHCPHLAGSIPTEIGRLTQAKHLVMNHAMLSGSLPSEIGLMTSLTALMLASNDLTGDIPEEIGNLVVNASLVHWTFAGNDFSEEKPTPFTPPGMPGWPGQFPPIASPPEIVINIQHGNQAHSWTWAWEEANPVLNVWEPRDGGGKNKTLYETFKSYPQTVESGLYRLVVTGHSDRDSVGLGAWFSITSAGGTDGTAQNGTVVWKSTGDVSPVSSLIAFVWVDETGQVHLVETFKEEEFYSAPEAITITGYEGVGKLDGIVIPAPMGPPHGMGPQPGSNGTQPDGGSP